MRHLVILNPRAGRGRRDRSVERLRRCLDDAGLDYRLQETRGPGHAETLIREEPDPSPGVIVVGGDGTLHEVLQGLELGRQRLGVIPWGTGNDFAYAHGWPGGWEACVARIARGGERRVDLGRWEADRSRGRFHNSVGLGFEALVNQASHRITRIRGPLVYVVALLKTLPRYRAYPVRIQWNTGSFTGDVSLLTVANGPRVGGCFRLAPAADPADGALDLVYAGPLSRFRAMTVVPSLLSGTHLESPRFRIERSPSIEIQAAEPIPVYVDGEFAGPAFRSVRVTVDPGALRTF